jgi:O-antigen/teichoic acid export membrane protein
MKRRVLAGMGANSFGMALTIGIQLVSLPIFLHYWNTSTYGVWLMLSAIPAYLSMADVGMVSAAGNKMTIAIARGDLTEANKIFQSALKFMTMVCSFIAFIALIAILFTPKSLLSNLDLRLALLALCFGVLIALFDGLSQTIFKATQRYAIGTTLGNFVRLAEWAGYMIGLASIGTFTAVALCGFFARLVGTIIVTQLSKHGNHGIHWSMRHADNDEIRAMIKPAISFMAFPLASALSLQGLTLLVGVLFGPITVAIFNTYRTIVRIAVQITAIFSHALWPEFSRLFGEGEFLRIHHVFNRSAALGALQAFALSLLLYFTSPWLLKFWTHGEIEYIPSLMLMMLIYAAVSGAWHIPKVLLMATNQHIDLAYWAVFSAAFSVLLALVLSIRLDLNGIVVAMLLSELLMASICFYLVYKVLLNRHVSKTNESLKVGITESV